MTNTAPARDRAAIEANLDEAERAYQSTDPYRRAAGYDLAGRLYGELANHVDDRTLAAACMRWAALPGTRGANSVHPADSDVVPS